MPENHQHNHLMMTHHAVRRFHQRVARDLAEDVAALRLHEALADPVELPLRHVLRSWCCVGRGRPRRERQRGARYMLAGSAVVAVVGGTVITTLRCLDVEDLATLLVWTVTGVWVEG